MRIVKDPDEIHRDKRGGVHAMKRFDENHFTVVIYEFEGSTGFIRTAYLISNKRKSRRYGSL